MRTEGALACWCVWWLLGAAVSPALAQAPTPPRQTAPARPATPARPSAARATTPPAPVAEAANLTCPSPLGTGVSSRQLYCDVVTGRDLAEGIQITLPPHSGPLTLTFDLHNRHLYSEDLIARKMGYRHYTATIGVLTADNTLISRAVVQNEFRTAGDLVERIAADGAAGVKAVAPSGTESLSMEIPEGEMRLIVLGEKLTVIRPDGTDNFSAPGRPIALISNVKITYLPPPPKPAAPVRRPPARRTPAAR